ncbi:MAG: LytTR family DNA-binding domain-containing protein [Bacillota bacterium]|nr:LytTR family DNA-binding domain-containing protein [Bacillota bacterium]
MKITLNQDPAFEDTEVIINCPAADEDILRIVALLRIFQQKLTGVKDGQTHLIDLKELLYIESVDKKTFFYTAESVYESPLRLYELEERLAGTDFFRASKSTIVNFLKIRSLCPEMGGRMILTMENGERLYVSRQYAVTLKEKLHNLERRLSK